MCVFIHVCIHEYYMYLYSYVDVWILIQKNIVSLQMSYFYCCWNIFDEYDLWIFLLYIYNSGVYNILFHFITYKKARDFEVISHNRFMFSIQMIVLLIINWGAHTLFAICFWEYNYLIPTERTIFPVLFFFICVNVTFYVNYKILRNDEQNMVW